MQPNNDFSAKYANFVFNLRKSYLWWALELMRHSKSVRLETAPTSPDKSGLF